MMTSTPCSHYVYTVIPNLECQPSDVWNLHSQIHSLCCLSNIQQPWQNTTQQQKCHKLTTCSEMSKRW